MKGKLFIISGQSGVGKNTILKAILANHPEFHRAVTCTTRDPRPNEIPGEDHYFIYKEKFDEMVQNNEFLECAKVHDKYYNGTPKEQILTALKSSKNVLMEIDVQGALQIKEQIPEAILIFIKYDHGDLEEFIRHRIKNDKKRGLIPQDEIKIRIESAKAEAKYEKDYNYSVVNPEGHPEKAIADVEEIIAKNVNIKN